MCAVHHRRQLGTKMTPEELKKLADKQAAATSARSNSLVAVNRWQALEKRDKAIRSLGRINRLPAHKLVDLIQGIAWMMSEEERRDTARAMRKIWSASAGP